jgi:hypothetical protein
VIPPIELSLGFGLTRIINAANGELLRQLTAAPTREYQLRGGPCGRPKKSPNPKRGFGPIPMSYDITQ